MYEARNKVNTPAKKAKIEMCFSKVKGLRPTKNICMLVCISSETVLPHTREQNCINAG
jgi:hypothetical protein